MEARQPVSPLPRVVIIELDDVVPGRSPALPNLLATNALDPQAALAQISAGRGHAWALGHVLGVQEDLLREGESKTRARVRLMEAGYPVNRVTRTWRVYVLELDLPAPGSKGWLYVGETSRDVPTRIEQHLTRARNAKGRLYSEKVAAHFVRRRSDVEPDKVLMSAEASRRAERRWAKRLRNSGWTFTSG